ncbi:MAG: hypothetical protein ACRD1T_18595 [Acidimicrobiia bacterium]
MNATAATIWLACAENGEIVDSTPYRLDVPAGLERGQQLVALLEDCARVLQTLSPRTVAILDPELIGTASFKRARDRAKGEVLLSLAAAQLGIACSFVSRQGLRSKLGLGRSGKLVDLVATRIPRTLNPHWKGKRDLAALAALVGQEDFNAAG